MNILLFATIEINDKLFETTIRNRAKRLLSTLCEILHTYHQKLNTYYFKVLGLQTQPCLFPKILLPQ